MNPYLYVLFIALVALCVGLVFIYVNHLLEMKRDAMKNRFVADDLLGEVQGVIEETLNYAMDMVPGKLIQARKMMKYEGDETEWTP